ncbi:MAG: YCF48-related protein, partial [bacterium]
MWKHNVIQVAIFCSAIFLAGNAIAQLCFEEDEWDDVATVNPQDTIHGVAIYASATDSSNDSLPSWWMDIWNDSVPNSVPRYYLENSFNKHGLFAEPYGRDSTFCFVSSPYSGVAVGYSGTVVGTNDLLIWGTRVSGTTNNLHGVSFVGALTGTAVGDSGTILRTTNFGRTWKSQNSPTNSNLRGVSFIAYFIDGVVAVGDSGTILRTTDGGKTWGSRDSKTANDLYSVSFSDTIMPASAIAVGDSGRIVRSTNYGLDWDTVSSTTTKPLRGVFFTSIDTAFAVGDSGIILNTTNAGETWSPESSWVSHDLYGVSFISVDTGFAVGESGTILRTTDAGTNWEPESSDVINDLYGVSFSDTMMPASVIAVGDSGRIVRSTNYGADWDTVSRVTTNPLYGLSTAKIRTEKRGGGWDFTWDILTRADSVIDFARPEYDADNDHVVDMVLLIITRFSGSSHPYLIMLEDSFPTTDTSGLGDTVYIWKRNATVNLGGLGVVVHEYGHKLGLPDYYKFTIPDSGSALGSFEPMTGRGFHGRVSPFNPWFRSSYEGGQGPFGWLTLTTVTSSSYDQPIQDITSGEVYELVSDIPAEPLMEGQRFLVSNHQQKSFWEENWPAPGLMIWHVFDNDSTSSLQDSRRKIVDLEPPHGLWDWGSDTSVTSSNPVGGLDSLDVAYVEWPEQYGGKGSPTCIYRTAIDSVFDAFSNPSSDEYNIDYLRDPVSIQDIASHIAVRNIHQGIGDTVKADLIVNRVESDVGTATGRNNARRWIL